MVKAHKSDGMIARVACATASVLQAASLTVGLAPGNSVPSSFFIMNIPQTPEAAQRFLIFADCAVNICPLARELAEIVVTTGKNDQSLLGIEPRIAFLSFATHGSASHEQVDKIADATARARLLWPQAVIDGPLQADTALSTRVAGKKAPKSPLAGSANILIFPDLNAGNIAYKMVQYLAGAQSTGPVLQGFSQPVNDMSRGASVEDIINLSAITCVQAQGANT